MQLILPWFMVFLAGLCLRTGISSLSPILALIQQELRISNTALAMLTALPVICMGLLSPLAYWSGKRYGLHKSMLAALALLTFALAVRLGADSFGILLLTAGLVGIADAIIRPLLSGFIKEQFAQHTQAAMGLYAAAMGAGSAAAAYGTPLFSGENNQHWQAGLAVWAIPAGLAWIIWGLWRKGCVSTVSPSTSTSALPKYKLGLMIVFFGCQAGSNYTIIAWL